jgi:hypothetical protein
MVLPFLTSVTAYKCRVRSGCAPDVSSTSDYLRKAMRTSVVSVWEMRLDSAIRLRVPTAYAARR